MAGRLGRLLTAMAPPAGAGRIFALSTVLSSVGVGLYSGLIVIYFNRDVGFAVATIGLGLSIAGAVAVPMRIVLGRLADRIGPKPVTIALELAQAALVLTVPFIGVVPAYIAVVVLLTVAEEGAHTARGALITAVLGRQGRTKVSAYLRSAFNAAATVGFALSGLVLAFDTHDWYIAAILVTAGTRALGAILLLRLPAAPPSPAPAAAGRWSALRDFPYVAVAFVSGIAGLGDVVLTVGIPLWLVNDTHAPRPLAAWLVVLNTILVVLLQVPLTRDADSPAGAARLQRRAFAATGVACAIAGLAAGIPAWAATVVLALSVLLLTVGEMWGAAGGWGLRYELAPAHAQGQYGGVFALGSTVRTVVGPLVVTVLIGWHAAGWLAIAAIFVLGMLVNGPAVNWAVRTRPPEPTTPEAVGDPVTAP
ncbi:MFS transporter [Dactylosporangium salmoneum]|uniref:MFS transporter n=1 Tax=Dactylosporangium salmoneum TaxID=53361 RepID=A0ABP5T010_9ACTN